jgi:hypothetical protein
MKSINWAKIVRPAFTGGLLSRKGASMARGRSLVQIDKSVDVTNQRQHQWVPLLWWINVGTAVVIHANSPQAKGRVERLFKTLQDRLVREMRLLGIKSVVAANAFLESYLPTYNRRFARPAASTADLHRPAPSSRELDRILCIKEERTVKNDFTIAHHGALYQLDHATRAKKVTVEERLDGTLRITYHAQELRYRAIPARPPNVTPDPPLRPSENPVWIPPTDHPWRKLFLRKRRTRDQSIAAP